MIAVFVLLGLSASPAEAAVWTVTSTADQACANCPIPEGSLRDILYNKARLGDEIGFAVPKVVLEEPLDIQPELSGLTIAGPVTIGPGDTGRVSQAVIRVAADSATITKITFENAVLNLGDAVLPVHGLKLNGNSFRGYSSVTFTKARDCEFIGNSWFDSVRRDRNDIVTFQDADHCTIEGNDFGLAFLEGYYRHIVVFLSEQVTIRNNIAAYIDADQTRGSIVDNKAFLIKVGAERPIRYGLLEIKDNESTQMFVQRPNVIVEGNTVGEDTVFAVSAGRAGADIPIALNVENKDPDSQGGQLVIRDNAVTPARIGLAYKEWPQSSASALIEGNRIRGCYRIGLTALRARDLRLVNNAVQDCRGKSAVGMKLTALRGGYGERNNVTGTPHAGMQIGIASGEFLLQQSLVSRADGGIEAFTSAEVPSAIRLVGCSLIDNRGHGLLAGPGAVVSVLGGEIRRNGGAGVYVSPDAKVAISQVSFDDNAGPGIDIDPAGVTPNDVTKLGNFDIDWPQESAVSPTSGRLEGKAAPGSTVEVYAVEPDPRAGNPANGEGVAYLGAAVAGTDGAFAFPAEGRLSCGGVKWLTLTATLPGPPAVTSEFSPDVECVEYPDTGTDRDGDGVVDSEDACPDTAGTPEADGCAKKQEFGDGGVAHCADADRCNLDETGGTCSSCTFRFGELAGTCGADDECGIDAATGKVTVSGGTLEDGGGSTDCDEATCTAQGDASTCSGPAGSCATTYGDGQSVACPADKACLIRSHGSSPFRAVTIVDKVAIGGDDTFLFSYEVALTGGGSGPLFPPDSNNPFSAIATSGGVSDRVIIFIDRIPPSTGANYRVLRELAGSPEWRTTAIACDLPSLPDLEARVVRIDLEYGETHTCTFTNALPDPDDPDGDTVLRDLDKCPYSPAGSTVNSDGCAESRVLGPAKFAYCNDATACGTVAATGGSCMDCAIYSPRFRFSCLVDPGNPPAEPSTCSYSAATEAPACSSCEVFHSHGSTDCTASFCSEEEVGLACDAAAPGGCRTAIEGCGETSCPAEQSCRVFLNYEDPAQDVEACSTAVIHKQVTGDLQDGSFTFWVQDAGGTAGRTGPIGSINVTGGVEDAPIAHLFVDSIVQGTGRKLYESGPDAPWTLDKIVCNGQELEDPGIQLPAVEPLDCTFFNSTGGGETDTDGDGVPDAADVCVNSAPGSTVDANGCAVTVTVGPNGEVTVYCNDAVECGSLPSGGGSCTDCMIKSGQASFVCFDPVSPQSTCTYSVTVTAPSCLNCQVTHGAGTTDCSNGSTCEQPSAEVLTCDGPQGGACATSAPGCPANGCPDGKPCRKIVDLQANGASNGCMVVNIRKQAIGGDDVFGFSFGVGSGNDPPDQWCSGRLPRGEAFISTSGGVGLDSIQFVGDGFQCYVVREVLGDGWQLDAVAGDGCRPGSELNSAILQRAGYIEGDCVFRNSRPSGPTGSNVSIPINSPEMITLFPQGFAGSVAGGVFVMGKDPADGSTAFAGVDPATGDVLSAGGGSHPLLFLDEAALQQIVALAMDNKVAGYADRDAILTAGGPGYTRRYWDPQFGDFGNVIAGSGTLNITDVKRIGSNAAGDVALMVNYQGNEVKKLEFDAVSGSFTEGQLTVINGVVFGNTRLGNATTPRSGPIVSAHALSPTGIVAMVTDSTALENGQVWLATQNPGVSNPAGVKVGNVGVAPRRIRCAGSPTAICAVSNFGSGTLSIVHWPDVTVATGASVTATVAVGNGPLGIDIRDDGNGLFKVISAGFNDNTFAVTVVDASGAVVSSDSYDLPAGCTGPGHAIWNASGSQGYVSCNGSNSIANIRFQ